MSIDRRIAALEAEALADWDEAVMWMANWLAASLAYERIEQIALDNFLTEDETLRMLADMPADLQAKGERACSFIQRREHLS